MKRFISSLAAVSISALLASGSALAGDYNSGVVTKTPSAGYTDVEFGSGWYIRGDITYNINGRSSAETVAIAGVSGSIQTDYDDAIGARVGFGNYITPNSRIEFSVEGLFNTSFDGINTATFAATDLGGAAVTAAGTRRVEGSYSATDFIVNGYYDLPSIGAFKPYVGLGGGVGRITLNQTETLVCSPIVGVSCDYPAGGSGEEVTQVVTTNDDFWTYVYQVSVGTAIAVDEKTSLDIGYSYTGFGEGDDLSYADGTAIDDDGFRVHQVRAGIRYDIW